jgi:hypothetical protein
MSLAAYVEQFRSLTGGGPQLLSARDSIEGARKLQARIKQILRFLIAPVPDGAKIALTPGVVATFLGAAQNRELTALEPPTTYEYSFGPAPLSQAFRVNQQSTASNLVAEAGAQLSLFLREITVEYVMALLFDSTALVTLVINVQLVDAKQPLLMLAPPLSVLFSHSPIATLSAQLEFDASATEPYLRAKLASTTAYVNHIAAQPENGDLNWVKRVDYYQRYVESQITTGPPPLADEGPPPLRAVTQFTPYRGKPNPGDFYVQGTDDASESSSSSTSSSVSTPSPKVSSVEKAKATKAANQEIIDAKIRSGMSRTQAVIEFEREKKEAQAKSAAAAKAAAEEKRKEQARLNQAQKDADAAEIARLRSTGLSAKEAKKRVSEQRRQRRIDAMTDEEREAYLAQMEIDREIEESFIVDDDVYDVAQMRVSKFTKDVENYQKLVKEHRLAVLQGRANPFDVPPAPEISGALADDAEFLQDAQRFVAFRRQLEVQLGVPYRAPVTRIVRVKDSSGNMIEQVQPVLSAAEDEVARIQEEINVLRAKKIFFEIDYKEQLKRQKQRAYRTLLRTNPGTPRPLMEPTQQELQQGIPAYVLMMYNAYIAPGAGTPNDPTREDEIRDEMNALQAEPVSFYQFPAPADRVERDIDDYEEEDDVGEDVDISDDDEEEDEEDDDAEASADTSGRKRKGGREEPPTSFLRDKTRLLWW